MGVVVLAPQHRLAHSLRNPIAGCTLLGDDAGAVCGVPELGCGM
jgi:hypothetical protein